MLRGAFPFPVDARALVRRGLAAAACCLAAGCEAIIPYHWDSAEKDGEHVELLLDTVAAQDARPMEVTVPRGGTRASLHTDPDLLESRLTKLVSRAVVTSSRPPSSWGAKAAGDFYAAPPRLLDAEPRAGEAVRVEVRPGVRGLRLVRWLGAERATTLEFSIEPVADAFRVTLDRITVVYSRAKVADNSWVNFWTRIPLLYGFAFDIARIFGAEYGDGAVDMQIDLALDASWTDARGDTHFAPLAVMGWTILDVSIGSEAREVGQSSGWLPLPPSSVRVSAAGDTSFGQGHFRVWALVTEQDELSHEFIEERRTVGTFFDTILGLLPIPVPGAP